MRATTAAAILIGLGSAVFLAIQLAHNQPAPVDDSLIYLRVAQRLFSQGSLSYQDSDAVLPCTSLGWTLIVSAASWFGGATIGTLTALHALTIGILYLVIFCGSRQWGTLPALTVALFLTLEPATVRSVGLETPFFLAVMWVVAYTYSRTYRAGARTIYLGAATFVSWFTRPDASLMIGMLLVIEFYSIFRSQYKTPLGDRLFPIVGATALALSVQYALVGTLIPHTLLIKRIQSSIGFWAERGPWIRSWISQAPVLAHLWFLPGLGLLRLHKRKQLLSPLGVVSLFGLLQVAAYTVQGAPSGYPWYMAPGNHAVIALNIMALSWLGEHAVGSWQISTKFATRLGWSILACWGILKGLVEIGIAHPYRLAQDYQDAVQYIQEHDTPESTVACAEIGYIGFYSQKPILDMLGLLHHRSLLPLKGGDLTWWYGEHPHWIVTHLPRWTGEPEFKGGPSALTHEYSRRWHSETVELWERNPYEGGSAPSITDSLSSPTIVSEPPNPPPL